MDSRLMNVVYDDPFDGNYVKYDNDSEFWSSGSETMGMQLTETLNGILPISATDDFHKDEHTNAINIQSSKNAFNYEDFAGQHLATGGAIELVTVDPNADGYDTDSEDEEDSDDDDDDDDDDDEDDDDDDDDNVLLDFEHRSQCSNATFRSRTDSSSIGDYESHTSDYDDDDDDDDDDVGNNLLNNTSLIQNALSQMANNANNSIIDLHSNLVAPDDLLLGNSFHKSRTLSTNTLNSDVDGLGMQIDANNFDLAEFITKDDFQLNNTSIESNQSHAAPIANVLPKNDFATTMAQSPSVMHVISSKHDDSDSDSDVIVDVETVEMDEDEASSLRKASEILKPSPPAAEQQQIEEDATIVDNVKTDPSWKPTQTVKKAENHKVEEKSTVQKTNFTRSFPLVPNKKQCDLLKGKFAKGKGKASQKPTKTPAAKNIKMEISPVKETPATNTSTKTTIKPETTIRKIGIGMGGKNLALLKHERVSISEQSSEENNTPIKCEIVQPIISTPQQKPVIVKQEVQVTTPAQKAQAVKRKLNLEEYKKRRGGEPVVAATAAPTNAPKFFSYKIPKLENKAPSSQAIGDKKPAANTTTPTKHSDVVTTIVKSLKEQQSVAQRSDPITEAKNKVLRMQELKKAQQMRIIDSAISAKVPRVTKLLPLREIVKDTPYLNEEEKKSLSTQTFKSDYEEIIIVSSSCNTDISMPPIPNQSIQPVNNASRSLLKSSALLSTITNSFEKVKANDNTKMSTSSLIASIQDVVVNKTLPVEETTHDRGDIKDNKKPEHHGENKIIMHLRKDRIRKRMCTIGIQTELQPEFPPLPLPKSSLQHKSRERSRRNRKRHYRKHNEQSSSSSSEYSSDDQSDNSNSSTISRSRDNSCSSSLERLRTYDSAIGTGGYSSRSSRKHRSSISSSYSESADRIARGRRQRRTSYTKRSAARKRSRSPFTSSSYTSDSDRSRSPHYRRSRSRSNSRTRSRSRRSSYRQGQNNSNSFVDRNVSQPAVEERRIVYVGRIEQETTKDMLRRKFLQYGTIKQISIHYKDTGMKYGFVTFERSQDAFTAIDTSTRDPQISMYDVSFGGRRAFCRASYADLDNAGINTYQSYVFPQPAPQPKEDDSFEALLLKMKAKLNANKTNTTTVNGAAGTSTAGAAAATDTVATNGQNAANNKI
ncbi:uncharacterized protein srl [Calliphora vicina]|uniref:uncharacterized protein srl n=1 Tax=Calliphora vicina TaxID=7373 RepID=UPI00325B4FFF